jgi:hypothetical protein
LDLTLRGQQELHYQFISQSFLPLTLMGNCVPFDVFYLGPSNFSGHTISAIRYEHPFDYPFHQHSSKRDKADSLIHDLLIGWLSLVVLGTVLTADGWFAASDGHYSLKS